MVYRDFSKPLLDLLFGVTLSLVTMPLILLLCAIVRAETPGSPIFLQTRVGKDGAPFSLFKIRTMVRDASSLGPEHTEGNDRRITRVGKWLRKLSLDELPQLWNVALLQMSLIGPRPALPSQQSVYGEAAWRIRHQVRPGITGYSQCLFRSSSTQAQLEEYDCRYIAECSPVLDLWIVWKTVIMVLSGKHSN